MDQNFYNFNLVLLANFERALFFIALTFYSILTNFNARWINGNKKSFLQSA